MVPPHLLLQSGWNYHTIECKYSAKRIVTIQFHKLVTVECNWISETVMWPVHQNRPFIQSSTSSLGLSREDRAAINSSSMYKNKVPIARHISLIQKSIQAYHQRHFISKHISAWLTCQSRATTPLSPGCSSSPSQVAHHSESRTGLHSPQQHVCGHWHHLRCVGSGIPRHRHWRRPCILPGWARVREMRCRPENRTKLVQWLKFLCGGSYVCDDFGHDDLFLVCSTDDGTEVFVVPTS